MAKGMPSSRSQIWVTYKAFSFVKIKCAFAFTARSVKSLVASKSNEDVILVPLADREREGTRYAVSASIPNASRLEAISFNFGQLCKDRKSTRLNSSEVWISY